ncbi:MAG: hypothetical protein RL338_481 [Chloroflexota bacterium]
MSVTARPADHAAHDEIRVVAFACGDLADRDADAVAALVERCPECARLASDVAAIRAEIAGLPAPTRSRDFRLRPADLAAARGPRGLLGRLAAPRLAFAAPLGSALAALGLAGLLLGTPILGTGDGAAPLGAAPATAPEAAAPYAESAPVASMSAPADGSGGATDVAGGAPDDPAATKVANAADAAGPADRPLVLDVPASPAATGPGSLAVLSVALLAGGLVLLVLRLVAVRLAARRPAGRDG